MKWLNWLWIVLIPTTALAVVLYLVAPDERAVWTTDSPEALAAFEGCLEAHQKFYIEEAARLCAEAVEKDPDFVMAKMEQVRFLRMRGEAAEAEKLIEGLRGEDLSELTPRERFLIELRLAAYAGRREQAEEILESYLRKHPRDPWAISIQCERLWNETEPEIAEDCYQRLLDADPNWVQAQNRLGYLAMARGQFKEAEEHFDTYEYLAPDQANPHDSMGELLSLVGRYEDAEHELRRALEIRPDFCASYEHLVGLFLLQDRFDQAREAVEARQAEPRCEGQRTSPKQLLCVIDGFEMWTEQRWDDVWELVQGPCGGISGEMVLLAHQAALRTGRREEALALEREHEEGVAEAEDYPMMRQLGEALLAHMRGVRLRIEGQPAEAAKRFEETDRLIPFWFPEGPSSLKLHNQLVWAASLAEAGRKTEAREVLNRVRAVNPRAVEHYDGPDLEE